MVEIFKSQVMCLLREKKGAFFINKPKKIQTPEVMLPLFMV